jgi:pimeloyl-ACP methyl ester carboxylesterase
MKIRRGFVDTENGQIHFRSCGAGKPVIMLHQTPRSSDEYLEVLPLVGSKFWAIAMDSIGFGDSYRFEGEMTIERLASGVVQFTSALNLQRFSLIGHHTGAVIAVEVAASFPSKVEKLVLSGCPYIDDKRVIDSYESRVDGSHLIQLWNDRLQFYPKNRPDILDRFIIDALKAGRNAALGHIAVSSYKMEDKLSKIRCPTLLIAGTADPFAHPHLYKLRENIVNATVVEIEGGTVALLEQMPEKFAAAVLNFLSS